MTQRDTQITGVTFRGKGRKQRTCPLWPRTANTLRAWLAELATAVIEELRIEEKQLEAHRIECLRSDVSVLGNSLDPLKAPGRRVGHWTEDPIHGDRGTARRKMYLPCAKISLPLPDRDDPPDDHVIGIGRCH
jgi:integrase